MVPTASVALAWAMAPPVVTLIVPPLTVVPPLYVLDPESVSVPAPSFSSVLPAPARPEAKATAWLLVSIRIAWPAAELIWPE